MHADNWDNVCMVRSNFGYIIMIIVVIIDVLPLATINHLSVLYTYMLVYRSLFCITIK